MLGFKITPLSIFSHELVRRERDKSVEGPGLKIWSILFTVKQKKCSVDWNANERTPWERFPQNTVNCSKHVSSRSFIKFHLIYNGLCLKTVWWLLDCYKSYKCPFPPWLCQVIPFRLFSEYVKINSKWWKLAVEINVYSIFLSNFLTFCLYTPSFTRKLKIKFINHWKHCL